MKLATFLLMLTVVQLCCAQQFTVQPESVVQAEGLEAVFECQYPGASLHGWGINGEFLPDDQFPSNLTRIPPSVDSPTARLIIPATPQYNNTVVQCEAVVREGGVLMSVLSENATLKVQGPLHHVTNLHFLSEQSSSTTITISWEAPFSLNLTTAEPDIQYCVDVVTGGGDDHLQSVCDITDTHYTLTASDPDQLFNLTVTPRSNVEGSLNGTTSQPVQGYLIQGPIAVDSTEIQVIVSTRSKELVQVMFPSNLLGSPGHTPTHYNIKVDCDQIPSYNCSSNLMIESGMVEIVPRVEKHHICNLTLFAVNNAGTTQYTRTSNLEKISTFHVRSVQANYSTAMNQMDISCSYLHGSTTDPGYFVIVFPQDSLPSYCAAYREGTEASTAISIHGQFDNATVIVYDLKNVTGLPENRPSVRVPYANTTDTGRVHNETMGSTLLESYSITGDNGEICINCSFSVGELTGCVGVIHSAQSEDPTLTVLTVERSGGRECKSVIEGDYIVALFGWLETGLEQEPANVASFYVASPPVTTEDQSTLPAVPAAIPAVVVAVIPAVVVAVMVAVVVVMILVVRLRRRKRVDVGGEESPPRYGDLPLHKSRAGYENVALTTLIRTGTEPQQQDHNSQTQVGAHPLQLLQLQQESGGSPRERFMPKVLYAHLNVKSDNDQPSMDPTTVQYASIDKQKLAPASEESQNSIEQVTPAPPSPPPPPTPETVLSELHPIAKNWEELGEALGVPEHILDNVSMEGSDQVRLHEMVQYYLQSPHSWEEIVRALEEIGEIEAADKIVRTKRLEVSPPVTFSNDSPPLPPRNGANDKFSGSVPESNSTSGEDLIGLNLPGANSKSQEKDGRKISNKSGPVTCGQNVFRSHVYEKEVQHHEQCRPQVEDANETQHFCQQETVQNLFQLPCVQETEESSPAHEWSSRSYYLSLAHSLGLYRSFDAPERFKARAIRTLTCGTNDLIHPDHTVQQWMEGLESEESTANYDCHVVEELSESDTDDIIHNNNSSNLSTRSDLVSKNNSYTKHSVPEKFLCQSIFIINTPVTGASNVSSSQPPPGDPKLPPQESDSETSVLTEPEGTPLVLAATLPLTMSAQYGDGGGDDSSPWETIVESAKQDSISDQQWVDKSTEEKTGKGCYPQDCFFSWLIETFHPPEHFFPSKGIQLREHGYIFQPGDGEEFLGVSSDGWGNGGRILLPDTSWVKQEELRFFEHLHTHMCPTELASPIHDQPKSLSSTGSDKVNLEEIGSAPMQMKIASLGCWDIRLAAAAETLLSIY